jgi:uncharacterized RDD family membrane protein YckC/Tfp pilus assembly major pilin PilA
MQKEVTWYFVDLLGHRKGPVTQQQLLDAVAEGRIRPTSLVWREGLTQWQPLSAMEHELRQASDAVPPPLATPSAYVETNPFATSPSGFVADWGYASDAGAVIYGGFARRLLAFMLDALILWILGVVVGAIVGAVIGATVGASVNRTLIVLWVYPILFLVSLLYYSLQESSTYQATFGKRALGIKVTNLDGKPIGWGRAVGRWFGRMLSGLIFCLGYLFALFTSRKQTLHDMLSSTLVVDRWAYTRHPERQKNSGVAAAVAVVVVLMVFVAVIGILAAIAIPQYQMYVMRSQVANAYHTAETLKPNLIEAYRREQHCPVNGDTGLLEAQEYSDQYISAINIGTSSGDANRCALEVTLRSTNVAINGKHLLLSTAPVSATSDWSCSSDLPEKYLPPQCR